MSYRTDNLYLPPSVQHLLTVWRLDGVEKAIFFNAKSLKVLFRKCSPDNVVQFLKQTYLPNCESIIVHLILGVLLL